MVGFWIILSEYRGDAERRKVGGRGRVGVLTCAGDAGLHRAHARHRVHEVRDHRGHHGRLLTLHNHLAQQVYRRDAGNPRGCSVCPVRLRLGRLRSLRGRRLRHQITLRAHLSYVAEERLELSLRRRSPEPPQVAHHVLHARGSFHRHGELFSQLANAGLFVPAGYAPPGKLRVSCASRLVTTAPGTMRRRKRRPRNCDAGIEPGVKATSPAGLLQTRLGGVTFTRPSGCRSKNFRGRGSSSAKMGGPEAIRLDFVRESVLAFW